MLTRSEIALPGYQTTEQLYVGSRTQVYRAVRAADRQPVVIKLLKNEHPSFSELVQFRSQYTISKNLRFPGIIQSYSLEPYRNGYALVMEDFGGISLREYVKAKSDESSALIPELEAAMHNPTLPIRDFLEIALQLGDILQELCRQRVLHKDIKPANILINPNSKEVKLIDFSIASLLPKETQEIINPNVLEGTLAYLSPEQTGRMNRGIDYRSDFYSLGVTCYELLTGQLPFSSTDPMELVHCHISQQPPLLHSVNPQLPPILSEIVAKLMAKNAEDRYQSAFGLRHDLEVCLKQWQEQGKVAWFTLGQRDLSDRFVIPERLYGRAAEVSELLSAFNRVSEGTTELLLVAGFSGIGKTAVINEVHKPIVRQRGYFIKGKFDQFGRNIPFSAFVQALRDLMGQLLSESDAQLAGWKAQILGAVGENGQVMLEVIPELEQMIGKQPPVPQLSGSAAQNRFNLLFQKFMRVLATAEHPLVVFIDDLQWADAASLNLIKLLMSEAATGYLLLLGAYRDNEVFPAHPLMLTLAEIKRAQAMLNTITLRALSLADINQLVADTLSCTVELAHPLGELVEQKTQGNPFFTTQFLKALHDEQFITFDFNFGYWQCDMAQVRTLALTDDVVEFMALQLQKLPAKTQDVLKLAACIGAGFDLDTLAIVSQSAAETTAADLWKALQEGLVLPTNDVYKFYQADAVKVNQNSKLRTQTCSYRFLHDRVQQAAYSLIPDDAKQVTHLQIGRLLQQATPISEREEKIFALVNHLNQGASLMVDEQEQQELVQLNLAAGQKARSATAYGAALDYFKLGMALLKDDCWQEQYELTLALYEGATNSAYLSTDFEQMEQLAAVVLNQAHSWFDRIDIYETKIQACMAQNQQLEALRLAREVLEKLGVSLPEQPTHADVEQAIPHTQALLGGKSLESLLELPEMTAPKPKAAMVILSRIIPAAYQAAPNLLLLVILTHIDLSLHYGNAPESANGYVLFGLIQIAVLGNIDAGCRFGQLGMNLSQRIYAPKLTARIIFGFNCLLRHWQEPAKNTLAGYLQAYAIGLEVGDIEHAALGLTYYALTAYHSGRELCSLQPELEAHCQIVQQLRQATSSYTQRIYCQVIANLLETTAEPDRLHGKHCDEEEMIPLLLKTNDLLALYCIHFNKLILSYLFQRHEQALENASIAEQYLGATAGLIHTPLFFFYDALVQLAVYPAASETEKTSILNRVTAHQEKLDKWAVHAPSNQAHRCELIAAERCRVLGQNAAASEYYDRAIALANEHEYLNEAAIATELAAKFYLEWGKERIAQEYLIEAYYSYARWEARAKVVDLETRYPDLLAPILRPSRSALSVNDTVFTSETVTSTSSSNISDALDLAAILKASQTLSQEIEVGQLLSTLLQLVIKNAGADKCVLLLQDDRLLVKGLVSVGAEPVVLSGLPVEESQDIPHQLIYKVKNCLEPVVLLDATAQTEFVTDPYFRWQQPKSILCSPILHQGKLLGLVYLENKLTLGAFTNERVHLLNLLCAQAAISLENAQLYQRSQDYAQELEQSLFKVQQKTEALEQALQELQQAQLQMIQSEKMSALGNLVAGVAHEINNPVGFIAGNLQPARDYIKNTFGLLALYQQEYPNPSAVIQDEIEAIDLEYVREDLPKLIHSMTLGVQRIREISTSLRTFSRADRDEKVPFNLHDGIDSTILLLKHRLKANSDHLGIAVVKAYGNLPLVECFPGQLNQVFMNILANAIDALEEGMKNKENSQFPPTIHIRTALADSNQVAIRISDNGRGMSENTRQRIFDHLFTTKAVGKGTGLGLAIAQQIVVEKHGGKIEVYSILGKGAEFVITLPVTANS